MLLFSFNVCSPSVYAKTQGGAATSGAATGGAAFGGPGPGYGCTNNYYGGTATSGSATGGATTSPSNFSLSSPLMIDGIPSYDMVYHKHTQFHFHTHLDIFVNGVNLTIPKDIGIRDNCFYWLHTHYDDGTIHVESPINMNFVLGMFFDIWGKQFYDAIQTLGNPPVTKAYINGKEVKNIDYRQIPLGSRVNSIWEATRHYTFNL